MVEQQISNPWVVGSIPTKYFNSPYQFSSSLIILIKDTILLYSWARSSVGQSNWLIIKRSGDHAPPGPHKHKLKEIQNVGYISYIIKDVGKHNDNFVNEKFIEFINYLKENNYN